MSERTDEELLDLFSRNGDRTAFETLLRRHEKRVYGLAYRTLGNPHDALDAAQTVFISLFRNAGRFEGRSAFTTWLYRLTINACRDLARRRARDPVPVERIHGASGPQGDPVERLMIEQALTELPSEQRLCVVLRDVYGCTYEEIADAAAVPVGTVKSRIARGRSRLADRLAEHEQSPDRLKVDRP